MSGRRKARAPAGPSVAPSITTDFELWEAQLAASSPALWSAVRRFLYETMIGLGRCYCPHAGAVPPRLS